MIRKTTMNMCGTLGPVRHGRDIVATLVLGEPPGEIGVVEIAEWQRDPKRRQDTAVDDVGRQVDDMQAQPGQHDDVEDDVGEQTEETVPIAGNPPARGVGRGIHRLLLIKRLSGARQ
jgi:hypothetical protein